MEVVRRTVKQKFSFSSTDILMCLYIAMCRTLSKCVCRFSDCDQPLCCPRGPKWSSWVKGQAAEINFVKFNVEIAKIDVFDVYVLVITDHFCIN